MLGNLESAIHGSNGADNKKAIKEILASDIPEGHPVSVFERIYCSLVKGALLPHEQDLIDNLEVRPTLKWAQLIEPVENRLNGVDFLVVRSGKKFPLREGTASQDYLMRDGLDTEFVESRYREVITSAILRRPLFSVGPTPTRKRAFIYVIRGIFPVFADTRYRLRIFLVSAEPYIVLKQDQPKEMGSQ